MLNFSNQLTFRSIYQHIIFKSYSKQRVCELKLPFFSANFDFGRHSNDGSCTRRLRNRLSKNTKRLHAFTRVHVAALMSIEGCYITIPHLFH